MMSVSEHELFHKYTWAFFDKNKSSRDLAVDIQEKHYFITGATGLFGSWLLSFMDWCHARNYSAPQVTVLVRRNILPKRDYVESVMGDIGDFCFPERKFDRLIHLAAPSARDTFEGMTDQEKLQQLYFGTRHILEFASNNIKGRSLFTSSGAIYGGFSIDQKEPIAETNRFAPLSSFDKIGLALGKRVAEFLISDYGRKDAVDAGIARCFSFIGPGLPLDLHYAVGNFISRAVKGKNITINGDGTPIRSFMYLGDAINWLLTILEQGKPGEDFNVGSEQSISIADLATTIRNCIDPDIQVEIKGNSNVSSGNPLNHYYVPDVQKVKLAFGLTETMTLQESIKDLGSFVREEAVTK